MAKINEFAKGYEPTAKIKNIADLQSVSTEIDVKEETEAEYPYFYVEVEGIRYRVPKTVISSLKAILEENPVLKKFKVKKAGEGLETTYTVIPLA